MNDTWVKANFVFQSRAAVLRFRMRDIRHQDQFVEALSDPIRLEAYLRIEIETARPDLKGCELYGMRANFRTKCWEITIAHGSLTPLKTPFDELPVIDLWTETEHTAIVAKT